ncbi:MAG TPA: transporter [bacterium]|nr:transporter [bacterium]
MRQCIFTLLLCFSFFPPVSASDLITDRPDFTESALVIPQKTIQIEFGADYSKLHSVTGLSCPALLIRTGLGHNLEIRLGYSGWTRLTRDHRSRVYADDMILEAKYQLADASAGIPMAVLLVSTLPTGHQAVSVGNIEPGIKFACGMDLSRGLDLGVNLGALSVDAGTGRELLSLASVSLGIAVTERLGGFVETFAEIPRNASWRPVFDGGLTYRITPVLQADLFAGAGLNRHAVDRMAGMGLSCRFGWYRKDP